MTKTEAKILKVLEMEVEEREHMHFCCDTVNMELCLYKLEQAKVCLRLVENILKKARRKK